MIVDERVRGGSTKGSLYSEIKAMERYYERGPVMVDIGPVRIVTFARMNVMSVSRLDPIIMKSWSSSWRKPREQRHRSA
jgi:hypothetical protein